MEWESTIESIRSHLVGGKARVLISMPRQPERRSLWSSCSEGLVEAQVYTIQEECSKDALTEGAWSATTRTHPQVCVRLDVPNLEVPSFASPPTLLGSPYFIVSSCADLSRSQDDSTIGLANLAHYDFDNRSERLHLLLHGATLHAIPEARTVANVTCTASLSRQ
jgi:hypothetical protein